LVDKIDRGTWAIQRNDLALSSEWWTDLVVRRADIEKVWAKAPQAVETGGIAKVRSVMEAIKADRKQIKRTVFDDMVRELVDRRIKREDLNALWRELAPEEWRKQGQGSTPKAAKVEDWRSYLQT
jgi:hypothetical protein